MGTEVELPDVRQEIPDILSSLNPEDIPNFKPFVERYFKEMYCVEYNNEKQKFDTNVRIHNNGICLVYLADRNSVVNENKPIKTINFKINENLDRTKNSFRGKRKKGAQVVQSNSVICYVECEDGSSYPVYAGVPGRLLEVNINLTTDPEIIRSERKSDGYVCIIHPDNKNPGKFSKLISLDDYLKE